ncbi:MAG: hypothetical protein V3U96_07550 [Paracoccaceae bacterium]
MIIVILPGLDGTGELLSEVSDLLATRHDPIAIQYPSNLFRYEDIQAWVEEFLPKDDYIIVAESFSGPLAVMIAAKRPFNLKGVVFVATFAKAPKRFPIFLTYFIEILPLKSKILARMAQPLLMGRWTRKEFTTNFQKALSIVPPSTIAGRLREILNVDVRKQLHTLNVPAIYLSAASDLLVPAKMALDFQLAPGAISQLEGPHFLLQANYSMAAKRISEFASSLG